MGEEGGGGERGGHRGERNHSRIFIHNETIRLPS